MTKKKYISSISIKGNQLTGGYSVNSAYYSKFNFGFDAPSKLTDELSPDLHDVVPAYENDMKEQVSASLFVDYNSLYPSSLQRFVHNVTTRNNT